MSGTNNNGDGSLPTGPNARLNNPDAIAVNGNGQVYYIADTGDQKIRWGFELDSEYFCGKRAAGLFGWNTR